MNIKEIECYECGKCQLEIGLMATPESCWYCQSDLCSDCWETWGHCGHPEAYEQNAKAHVARIKDLEAENKRLRMPPQKIAENKLDVSYGCPMCGDMVGHSEYCNWQLVDELVDALSKDK